MREITLEGYADSIQYIKPVIEVAEVADLLKIKPGMQDIYNRLKTMLDSNTADDGTVQMPFLSETNAGQALSSNHKLVNFMNGKGLRYITFMTQGVGPINNDYLLYIYQGLTADGKYYVSATMPISAKALPDPATVPDMMDDVDGYYKRVSDMLDQQPANAFTPDLDYLDFFFISFNVKERPAGRFELSSVHGLTIMDGSSLRCIAHYFFSMEARNPIYLGSSSIN